MKLKYEVFYPSGDKQRNAPPIIMLHGMIDSRNTWLRLAPNIANKTGRIVYTYDARNHGDSPWSDEMDWNILADDLGDFMKEHQIPKATLVGHSMGGRTAFTFTLKRPEMVEKLIVEDMATRTIRIKDSELLVFLINTMEESLNEIPEGVDDITAIKAIAKFMIRLIPEGGTSYILTFDAKMLPLRKKGNKFAWMSNMEALKNFLTTEKIQHDVSKLGIYNGDTMFLYGTKSLFKVHKDPLIEKLFPRAVKVGCEGANHLIHHEHPQKFEKVVCNFINNSVIVSKI